MNDSEKKPETIDEYIIACTPNVRPILERIRSTFERLLRRLKRESAIVCPHSFKTVPWCITQPSRSTLASTPPVRDESLRSELTKYAGEKGNLRFPLDEPIPYSLINRIVKTRLRENRDRKTKKGK